jgi:hypothetical protein
MWPFDKKVEEKPSTWAIDTIRDFRKVGETFKYLDRTCIVTAHICWTPLGAMPCLCADYCDNNGKIRQIKFMAAEIAGIKAHNS